MYQYHAHLTKIVDGDTMHVRVDLGMDIFHDTSIRLYGVDTPEMSTAEGKAVKVWVTEWFSRRAPGGIFLLHTIRDKREKYGRYLGLVYSLDSQHCLNSDLLAESLATPYTLRRNKPAGPDYF